MISRWWPLIAAAALLSQPVMAVAATAPAAPSPKAIAGQVLDDFGHGNFAQVAARFDAAYQAKMPAAKLSAVWQQVSAIEGAFDEIESAQVEAFRGYQIVKLRCRFERATLPGTIVLTGDGKVHNILFGHALPTEAYDPPSYADPGRFSEKPVTVGSGDWQLPGTLTLPKGKGPFPAIVLVHGSGASDRDETIGPNKPFKDLAWGLASRGVAVLRYDKRTFVDSAKIQLDGHPITPKTEAVDDAVSAAQLLARTPGVDPQRVYLLGHSLGGALLPRIAESLPRVAGLVVMAGETQAMPDAILRQMRYLKTLHGQPTPQDEAELTVLAKQVATADSPDLSPSTPASELPFGQPAAYYLYMRGVHPGAEALALHKPMLILQGDRDYQVTVDDDLKGWEGPLGGRPGITIKTYTGLDHLFLLGSGPCSPLEYFTPGHVEASVVADIAAWLLKRS